MDLAASIHLAATHGSVFQRYGRAAILGCGRHVELAWSAHSQCFVRSLMVKLLSPQIQCPLSMCPTHSFQFQTDVAVETFVRSVILRMSGSAAF